jgi:hypothetical protein
MSTIQAFVVAAGGNLGNGFFVMLFVIILLIAGLVVVFVYVHEQKRTGELAEVSREIGFPFFPAGDDSLLADLGHFTLFTRGRRQKIRNMMHGENSDVELAIFDYRYTTGGGKNSHTHQQSVIYFRSPVLALPHFAVRPEHLFHKIGGAFGYQDIDFDRHPRFSAKYLLRGDDEAAVRALFTPDVLAFFEAEEKICVEGGGDQLIFYRRGVRAKPSGVHAFMEEGLKVFDVLRSPEEG